ncbi:hypothetical protein BDR03DRAFT_943658 [Suillus americanus]|nr:hypothetical protein BDR03DRAFT_943658 [Suillus americanus]
MATATVMHTSIRFTTSSICNSFDWNETRIGLALSSQTHHRYVHLSLSSHSLHHLLRFVDFPPLLAPDGQRIRLIFITDSSLACTFTPSIYFSICFFTRTRYYYIGLIQLHYGVYLSCILPFLSL